MENNKEIGKAFRNKLDVLDKNPSDRLWANIEKDLERKKRRSPIFWLLPLVLALGLSVGGFYYFSDGFGNDRLNDNGVNSNNNHNGNENSNVYNLNNNNNNNGAENNPKNGFTQSDRTENNSLKKNDEPLHQPIAIENNHYEEVPEQEVPIGKNTKKASADAKIKSGTGKSNQNPDPKQNARIAKTQYSREATRITTTAKRLVKSTPEFDEYEVVKKYTYVVRKKKAIVKTKNKALETPLTSEKSKIKKNVTHKNPKAKQIGKTKHSLKNNTSNFNSKPATKNNQKNAEKVESTIIKPVSTKSLEDETSESGSSDSKKDIITSEGEKSIPTKDTIQIAKDSLKKKKKKKIIAAVKKDSIPAIEKTTIDVFIYGSPTLAYSSSKNSPLDSRLSNNGTSSGLTFSYGGYICYASNKKLSIRIGFGKINTNFKTENVPVNTSNYSGIQYEGGFSNAFLYNQSKSESMTLIHELTYLEVPLELKYKFIDRKIGVHSIIGINYLILDKNNISAITANGNEYHIGKAKKIIESTFGLNFGFGLDYKISKRIKFNVEPMLKYNVKGYQNNEKGNPFSLNILTGLQFRL